LVFTAKDRSGLTGQFLLAFVLDGKLTQNNQVIRSGDPVIPGAPLIWKVHSPARLVSTDFAAAMDNTPIPFTTAIDPTDTTGRTWTVTTNPALAAGPHKASLAVGLAKGGATRVVDFDVNAPGLALKDVYAFPNPFHDRATLNFFVTSDQPADVLVRVFTVNGTLVWERFDKGVQPGYHSWEWDGRDMGGKQVAYGTYLFRVATAQGDHKASGDGKIVRAPERKTTTAATTP
jgi:hypothetical protein